MDGPPRNETAPDTRMSEAADSTRALAGISSSKNTTADVYARGLNRYRTDSAIKRILRLDAKRIAPDRFPWSTHRTVACTWAKVDLNVRVSKVREANSHHYRGLATCGSVWVCPHCSSKIQERRRHEVEQAIRWQQNQGAQPCMVSYTFPHRADQPLSLLLKLQQQAIKSMRESRAYKTTMSRIGNQGRIRALEVTHGDNGWHPHTHELLFVKTDYTDGQLRHELALLWMKACEKVGLFNPELHDKKAFYVHGVDVTAGNLGAAGYLAKLDDQSKWNVSHELTKSSSKQGRRSGKHPFQLVESNPEKFLEYVHAMKGERQIVWSRGLKKQVGIDEKTDEEVAADETGHLEIEFALPSHSWRLVLANDARWEILDAANRGGEPQVMDYLRRLGYVEESPGFEEHDQGTIRPGVSPRGPSGIQNSVSRGVVGMEGRRS